MSSRSSGPTPIARRVAQTVAICSLLAVLLPAAASAQMREFTGRVVDIGATQMVVDNRMGDTVSFMKIDATEVRGAKGDWGKIAAGDFVTISWKFVDKPRKAYAVKVLPPKSDG